MNQQKLDEVRRLVENNCKTGMSLDDLKVFLRDQGIKFDTDFSYSEREYGDTMPACIRKTKPWFSLTYSEGYFLLFVVDKENKLRSFSIKETFTGP